LTKNPLLQQETKQLVIESRNPQLFKCFDLAVSNIFEKRIIFFFSSRNSRSLWRLRKKGAIKARLLNPRSAS
jgi:hypothetical protein